MEPLSRAAFLNRYSGQQRQALVEAFAAYDSEGFNKREGTHNYFFVKQATSLKLNGKPRVIVSCNPKEKVATGPSVIVASDILKEMFHQNHYIFFECGSTQLEVGRFVTDCYQTFGDNILHDDLTDYDSTHSTYSLGLQNRVLRMWGVDENALAVLDYQLDNQHVRGRFGDKYLRPCFMRSGVPNTTFGNTLINAAMHDFAYRYLGFQPGRDYRMIIRGDDNLTFATRALCDRAIEIGRIINLLGFNSKIESVDLDHADFCSNKFWWTPIGLVPGPMPGKCMLKIAFTYRSISSDPRSLDAHAHGVAMGLLSQCNHVPLLAQYIQNELKQTQRTDYRQRDYKAMTQSEKEAKRYRILGGSAPFSPIAFEQCDHRYGFPDGLSACLGDWITKTMKAPGWYNGVIMGWTIPAIVERLQTIDT